MDKRKIFAKLIYVLAMISAIAPPLIAFLCRFPVLKRENYAATVSWFAVAMIAVCCIPFWRKIKEYFKSPDTTVLWLVVFVVFSATRELIDGMVVVAFHGLFGNLIAKGLFYVSHRLDNKKEASSDGAE